MRLIRLIGGRAGGGWRDSNRMGGRGAAADRGRCSARATERVGALMVGRVVAGGDEGIALTVRWVRTGVLGLSRTGAGVFLTMRGGRLRVISGAGATGVFGSGIATAGVGRDGGSVASADVRAGLLRATALERAGGVRSTAVGVMIAGIVGGTATGVGWSSTSSFDWVGIAASTTGSGREVGSATGTACGSGGEAGPATGSVAASVAGSVVE